MALPDQTVALDLSASPRLPLLVRHADGVGVLVGYGVTRCDLGVPGRGVAVG